MTEIKTATDIRQVVTTVPVSQSILTQNSGMYLNVRIEPGRRKDGTVTAILRMNDQQGDHKAVRELSEALASLADAMENSAG